MVGWLHVNVPCFIPLLTVLSFNDPVQSYVYIVNEVDGAFVFIA